MVTRFLDVLKIREKLIFEAKHSFLLSPSCCRFGVCVDSVVQYLMKVSGRSLIHNNMYLYRITASPVSSDAFVYRTCRQVSESFQMHVHSLYYGTTLFGKQNELSE